ncbi:HAMP domain-containing histidine kinase [Stieleria sp. TO1_6]|uniref:sensor histidine kinase n=1 Tax=Stieleria tagensis TaxID=2956795 RepID=UPI00209B90D5|nr:HAMP domain-containing sensor histidine kinase [Stieleria tagensis]MCO8124935.1 HAMP domain-containing histidine kinase [Stieleria tagensis]
MDAVTSLRNDSNDRSVPARSRDLGWWGVLPPICRQSQRWWLPLSDTALVALSHALATGHGDWQKPSPPAVKRVLTALGQDPPLLLFALLHWPGDDFVSATELAEWLLGAAAELFSGGQWILSAPSITDQQQRQWSRLMARSGSLAPNQWLQHAADWLQVAGPDVDADWIASLPAVIWDDQLGATASKNDCENSGPIDGSVLLQQIARLRMRDRITEHSLSALAEKRKNAAAKQLAYGLSHEINNPLANISARAQQLARDESDPARSRSLDQIVQQVYRAHEMIAGLMFFANPPTAELETVDLNGLIDEAADEFRRLADQVDIRLFDETLVQPALAVVDRNMMLEAVRVLVRNAMEAVGGGGTVVISIESSVDQAENPQWLIHVADSGPGLSSEATRHAFDPFYSGREAGRGLGLGLCRAYRVAKLHDATIRLSAGLAGCVATIAINRPR